MSISAEQRYYLKRKALYYFYEKGYSNTDIANMLGISRVTLNRLLAEAREEGMVKIEIIDTRNINYIIELEDRLKSRYGLEHVRIVDTDTKTPDQLISKLAYEGARHCERMLHSNMKVGIAWGKTLSTLINYLSPNPAISDIEVYTLMGGACSEAFFQPNLLAQSLLNYYKGSSYIINAPFICHSELLCAEIRKEPSIAKILDVAKNLDLALVGIGRFPTREHLKKSYYNFPDNIIDEIQEAGAVGDICGNFFDINGNVCKTSVSNRIVSIDIEDLKSCKKVLAVAGGESKPLSIRGALNGGFIDILITDYQTAVQVMDDDEQARQAGTH